MGQRFPFATFGGSGGGSSSAGSNGAGKKSASGLKPNTPANLIDLSDGSTVETGNADAQGKITFAFSPLPGRNYVVDGSVRLSAGSGAVVAPAAPTMTLTAGNGQVSIAWTDGATGGSAITSHKLYRGTVSGSLSLVGTITTASPYVDAGLTNGTAYFYQLTAVNGAGESVRSAEATTTPNAVTPFSLSQFPPAAILDRDPAVGVTTSLGKVTSFAAKQGTSTLVPTTANDQPTLITTTIAPAVPAIQFNGLTGGNRLAATDETFAEKWWDVLVLERPNANQNAVASEKRIMSTVRAGDGFTANVTLRNVTQDAEQDDLVFTDYGGGTGVGIPGVFPKASRRMFTIRSDYPQRYARSAIGESGPASGGASATGTQTRFGGFASTGGEAAFSLLRHTRLDAAQLPGNYEQLYNAILAEGLYAWQYGLVDLLPSDHPFKLRAPRSTDYYPHSLALWIMGTSIAKGWGDAMFTVVPNNALGTKIFSGGVGNTNSANNLTRFLAGNDIDTASSSGASIAIQRQRIFCCGDMATNDGGDGIPWDGAGGSKANIAAMVGPQETGQGVAAGGGRIIVTGFWYGNGNDGTGGLRSPFASAITKNQELKALYPNYFLDVGAALAADAAPGGLSPDAAAYAANVIPAAYRANGTDQLHLNTAGYTRAARIIVAFIQSKGWFPSIALPFAA